MRLTTVITAVCVLSVVAALWLALLDAGWLTWHWGLAVAGWLLLAGVTALLAGRYGPRGEA